MPWSLKLFLVSGSLFSETSAREKQISMIMADLSQGRINISLGIQEVSAHRLRKELINHNLYLFT